MHMYTHVLNQSLQFVECVVHLRFILSYVVFTVGWTITILLYRPNSVVEHCSTLHLICCYV